MIDEKLDLPSKPEVVFLQHGLMGTSADFVMGKPEKSLGMIVLCLSVVHTKT